MSRIHFFQQTINQSFQKNLSWAPEADERERIDFVYYYPNKNLQIKSAQIVGPTGSIVRGQRIEEQTKDPIIPPVNNQWPSIIKEC